MGWFASYGFERKRTWYPSGYSLESTITSATSRSAACRTSPRTVNAELVARNVRSLDGDRPPITVADVTRRRIGVVVDDDDDTDRLCGRTVSVDDDNDDAADSDVGDEADAEGENVATFSTPPGESGEAAFI
jgi:hypothetical protein